jgi:hypothetical protein
MLQSSHDDPDTLYKHHTKRLQTRSRKILVNHASEAGGTENRCLSRCFLKESHFDELIWQSLQIFPQEIVCFEPGNVF